MIITIIINININIINFTIVFSDFILTVNCITIIVDSSSSASIDMVAVGNMGGAISHAVLPVVACDLEVVRCIDC